MAKRPRDIGTAAETAVVKALRGHGFPHAERRALHGTQDLGDITGTPYIVWEVKGGEAARAASDGQIDLWLAETETERRNARATIGVLVVARRQRNPAKWWAIMDAGTLVCLANGTHEVDARQARIYANATAPVRLYLADLCRLLRLVGYGDPLPGGDAA